MRLAQQKCDAMDAWVKPAHDEENWCHPNAMQRAAF
jgi:hypothetical protein